MSNFFAKLVAAMAIGMVFGAFALAIMISVVLL